jgi:hypothetical protein
LSDHKKTDDFNKAFFTATKNTAGGMEGPQALQNNAPAFNLLPPQAVMRQELTAGDTVTKIIYCQSPRKAVSLFASIILKQPLLSLQVNEKEVERKPAVENGTYTYRIQYYALPDTGFYMALQTKSRVPVTVTLTDRSMGIPQTEYSRFPLNTIPAEGRTSNTTQVRKSFTF